MRSSLIRAAWWSRSPALTRGLVLRAESVAAAGQALRVPPPRQPRHANARAPARATHRHTARKSTKRLFHLAADIRDGGAGLPEVEARVVRAGIRIAHRNELARRGVTVCLNLDVARIREEIVAWTENDAPIRGVIGASNSDDASSREKIRIQTANASPDWGDVRCLDRSVRFFPEKIRIQTANVSPNWGVVRCLNRNVRFFPEKIRTRTADVVPRPAIGRCRRSVGGRAAFPREASWRAA